MNKKLSLILSVSVGAALFAALLTVASFYDLQISDALTKGSLPAGEYYSTNGFALFFEIVGFSVFYLSGAIASIICVAAAIKMRDGNSFLFIKEIKGAAYIAVKSVVIVGFSAFAVYEMYCVVHEAFKYPEKYLQDALQNLQGGLHGANSAFTLNSAYLIAVQVVFAAIVSGLVLALLMRAEKEAIFKLVRIAVILFLVELLYLAVVDAIKTPIGRMRYRTMNALGDFSYYTPWYVINGARNATTVGIIPSGGTPSADILIGAATDTCKSFPSGHTYGAAMSFALVCLPDLFDRFKKIWIKALCWAAPALYTVTVAVCRIVVGAHFFSDVLVGGTLAFTLIMIFREIFVLKCAHFKAFKKNTSL